MQRFAGAPLVARSFPLARLRNAALANLLTQLRHCSRSATSKGAASETIIAGAIAATSNAKITRPSFGSVVDDFVHFSVVVDALMTVDANAKRSSGKLAALTSNCIAHTLRLLDEKTQAGEKKHDQEERIALGKKHALIILALLVDGDRHVGSMERLSIALNSDPSGKNFGNVFKNLCLSSREATVFLQLSVLHGNFYIAQLAGLIPKDSEDIAQTLYHHGLLKEGHHFGSCKVWCPSSTVDKGFDRHIPIDPLYDRTVEEIRSVIGSDRAALVCGESGSGKTYSSILSAGSDGLCIYLTVNDFVDAATSKAVLYEDLKADAARMRNDLANGAAAKQNEDVSRGTLTELLGTLIRRAALLVGDEFAGRVVLVVDEVGGHPLIVKGLCREAKSMVRLLKKELRLTGPVGVVVSGTGSETGDEVLGSYPETYSVISCEQAAFSAHVVTLLDALGFRSLAGLLRNKPIEASYYSPTRGTAPSLVYVQRLLMNRRFAAALLSQLKSTFLEKNRQVPEVASPVTPQIDTTVPWLTVLPWLTSAALLQFKGLSALSTKSFDTMHVLFADALALCFGGHEQRPCDKSRMLNRGVGMIVDNARLVDPAEADLMVPSACRYEKYVLALPKLECVSGGVATHYGRRFGMGPATLEMGLQGFSLSSVARAHSGDGFEHTMVDYFHCWALACCSSVIITLPGEAPPGNATGATQCDTVINNDATARQALFLIMAEIRDKIRAEKVRVVLRVRLTAVTKTVEAAVAQAFAVAREMIREEGVPFVIVAHTAPLAPFADVFVVAGVTSSAEGPHAPTLFVAVQLKHTNSGVSQWDVLKEHLKQGCPIFGTAEGRTVAGMIWERGNSKSGNPVGLAKAHALLKAASAEYRSQYPFVSLVLAVCCDGFEYTAEQCAVEQFAGMTTVRIRSGALRSVIHPIPLASDTQRSVDSCFDDCMKNDFRK